MTQPDDFAALAHDDELLDAIAAGEPLDDEADAAAALLSDIAAAVAAERPGETGPGPGGGGGARKAIWGITLGVTVLVAAGGALSAAAFPGGTDATDAVVSAAGPLTGPLGAPPTVSLVPTSSTDAAADGSAPGWAGAQRSADAPHPRDLADWRALPWLVADPMNVRARALRHERLDDPSRTWEGGAPASERTAAYPGASRPSAQYAPYRQADDAARTTYRSPATSPERSSAPTSDRTYSTSSEPTSSTAPAAQPTSSAPDSTAPGTNAGTTFTAPSRPSPSIDPVDVRVTAQPDQTWQSTRTLSGWVAGVDR
ncbi:MAG: hypothetical protein FWD85_06260 [Microbacteriaceae bacterium]|nr:hypothetical protein [Microbacteriaceae bacterium]MCL2794895.1 hypothetical protein [Microbacteriaceae bacterium]